MLGDKKIVIPISGGLDSRGILAGMSQLLPKRQIHTVTLGIPGALDYDIGQKVARKAGIPNTAINLDNTSWDERDLVGYARKFNAPTSLLEGFLFSKIFDVGGPDAVYLSGFLGEALAGAHLKREPSQTWSEALLNFREWNCRSGFSHFTSMAELPQQPLMSSKLVSFDDQLDLFIRQRYFIRPIVPMRGYTHAMPYMDLKWIEFMLNLPHSLRFHQRLYKSLLLTAYPKLFSMPVKNTGGLPLEPSRYNLLSKQITTRVAKCMHKILPAGKTRPSPRLNYIDFTRSFREKTDLKAIAEKSLNDLHFRKLLDDIDIRRLWHEHQTGQSDHARLISVLISLEIFLKTDQTTT